MNKLAFVTFAFATTILGCATDPTESPVATTGQATNVRFTGDDLGGMLEATYGSAEITAVMDDEGISLSCKPAGEDHSMCGDGYGATLDAAVEGGLITDGEETASLAACWVKLQHCVVGGAYCSSRGCTFDESGDACTSLYYSYCQPWGY